MPPYCCLQVVDRSELPDGLDWIYWTAADGLHIQIARDAEIRWTRGEAFKIVGGVLRTIILGRGQSSPPVRCPEPSLR